MPSFQLTVAVRISKVDTRQYKEMVPDITQSKLAQVGHQELYAVIVYLKATTTESRLE